MTSFLDDPTDVESDKDERNMFEKIALVRFSTGYRVGFRFDEVVFFPFDANDKSTMPAAKNAAWKHINDKKMINSKSGKKTSPILGILCEIPLDTNLTASENLNFDLAPFIPEYQNEKANLSDSERELVQGKMPWDMILENLGEHPNVLGKFVWVKYTDEKNWYEVAKGNLRDGKYNYNPVVFIREIYANEEEARQAAGTGTEIKEGAFDDFGGGAVTPPDSKLSDLAVTNQWTEKALIDTLPSMEQNIIDVMAGKNPENKRMTKTEAANYVCGEYSISVKDLDFARSMVVEEPF